MSAQLSLLLLMVCAQGAPASPLPDGALGVHDVQVLRGLEARGLNFAERLTGTAALKTADVKSGHGYEDIVRVLRRDLARHAQKDPRAGVGPRFARRLFDARWLSHRETHFELVGVINRLDRAPFNEERCGETRLVYRLAYTTDTGLRSRLPMTLNLVYWQAGEDCGDVARRWVPASGAQVAPDWLLAPSGPLAPSRLQRGLLKSLEVNLQNVRWPSTIHPTLGGHAEYILRVFVPDGRRLKPGALENTPDVAKIRRNRRLRKALLEWMTSPETLAQIDEGTAVLPERFAATRATSVTPRGLSRLANRPFAQLFSERDLSEFSLPDAKHLGSPKALLRRLDGRTCVGCHQSRSLAGFHLPGEDPAEQALDALAVGRSPHFVSDQSRRADYVQALLVGGAPEAHRPPAERALPGGVFGDACGLGDPGFAAWTCEEGLVCQHVEDPDVGVCVSPGAGQVGEPCEPGVMRSRRVGHNDRVRATAPLPCAPGLFCESTPVGFPGGMCAATCGAAVEDAICGPIALLTPFNRCVGRGEPFTRCLAEHTRPAGLRRCDESAPCRSDYLCARVEGDTGACLPPYFLFQMRVDGH